MPHAVPDIPAGLFQSTHQPENTDEAQRRGMLADMWLQAELEQAPEEMIEAWMWFNELMTKKQLEIAHKMFWDTRNKRPGSPT